MNSSLRPAQSAVIEHFMQHGGKMGVSAVPGSGKTYTLSQLAARLVVETLEPGQEVLVVTLVNSAVDNFRRRIGTFVQEMGLMSGIGYRVRTLHGLAHDIVRQRPALVGLAEDFSIVDGRECEQILEEAVARWLERCPQFDRYVQWEHLTKRSAERVKKQDWPAVVLDVARSFIKRAKDQRCSPAELNFRAIGRGADLPLADMAVAIYCDYQTTLAARGGVDFDDLIGCAHRVLILDPDLLARLRQTWPYILEDEAQDSSQAQEDILRLLTDFPGSNWVRVGDPNQSIYNTFTTASPDYLRSFLREEGVISFELPDSGRSQPCIIQVANHLIDWVGENPADYVRDALTPPHVRPTPPGDPQPNPPRKPSGIQLVDTAFDPNEETQAIVRSVQRWLEGDAGQANTVVILVPSNRRGAQFAEALRETKLPVSELLDTTPATRTTAGVLGNVLKCLSNPASSRQLATLFHAWQRADWDTPDLREKLAEVKRGLAKLSAVEDFLWPAADAAGVLIDLSPELAQDEDITRLVSQYRILVRRWQQAASLPVDQLVLHLSADLFSQPADLALAHKLAIELRHRQRLNPSWRLPELVEELASIARNERRFLGFSDEPYEPRSGEVAIATMHRAKGLEWDRVYVTSVNNYDFPLGEEGDTYRAERWFIRDGLNLVAEALAQLDCLAAESDGAYVEGNATLQARNEYVSERLRLLYVAITRAKQELSLTWNLGRRADTPSASGNRPQLHQAGAFVALSEWWHTLANDLPF